MVNVSRKEAINSRISIEARGESRINRLARVASHKSTGQKVVELAWTAGPVTLIASVGGYYMGHGKALPKETLVFFVAYTVIAGVIGLGAHLFNRLTRDQKQEEAQEHLVRVMGGLPDMIISLRDLYLSSLDPESRRLEAARIMLQDIDLGPQWFASAVRSAGGSPELSFAAEEVEIYRRAGMNLRVRDIVDENREELDGLLESLRQPAPQLAESLENFFTGQRPSPREGVPRTAYFIERIFAAIDDDNDSLMTLDDVEEVFTLLFELLCGRSIPVLAFNYVGNWQLARATNTLERERFKFRIARAQGYSRLLALANHLNRFSDPESPSHFQGLSGPELLAFCTEQIEGLVARLQGFARQKDQGVFISPRRIGFTQKALEEALELYRLAHTANRKTDREYQNLLEDIRRWKPKIRGDEQVEVELDDAGTGKGLQIIEDHIYLSDDVKLKVVQALYEDFSRFNGGEQSEAEPTRRTHEAKQLAIKIALVLDTHLGISRPEMQRAIDNANTLNMGIFEKDLSTKTKIGWGEARSKEIEKDMRRASEALARAIYRFYGLKLNTQAQQVLAERYGTTVEKLQAIYRHNEKISLEQHSQQPVRPFQIPRAPLRWQQALQVSRHRL